MFRKPAGCEFQDLGIGIALEAQAIIFARVDRVDCDRNPPIGGGRLATAIFTDVSRMIAGRAVEADDVTIATLAKPQKATPLLFEGLTWREFKAVEQLLERPGYRLSFLDGVLEIIQVPSEAHETVKKRISALLELYLLKAGFDFTPTGSMTLESESGQVKREADESYKLSPGKRRPDLAIEVVFSSGGISKLEAYKRLKIAEVWFWEDGELDLYHLRDEGDQLEYERIEHSEAVPGLDLAVFQRCIAIDNHVEAVRTWQQGI